MIHEVEREGSEAVGKGKGKQAKRHQRNQKDRNKGTGAEAGSSVPPFFVFGLLFPNLFMFFFPPCLPLWHFLLGCF